MVTKKDYTAEAVKAARSVLIELIHLLGFKMPLTRKFKETVMMRAKQDPDFRRELIVEATNAFLDGDIDTGKRLIRDYLNATEGFPSIAGELKQNEKSIRRMIGPRGNPTLRNFANLLNACKRRESLELRVCR